MKTCGFNKLSVLALMVMLCLCATNVLWGFTPKNRHRPVPLMDYVPQEIGIYDTFYSELEETNCRGCHGNSLADRHHYTDAVIQFGMCTPCHEVISAPPGVVVIRDCKASGCHSDSSVDLQANGNHHRSELSISDNCVACHGPNIISELTPFSSFTTYPPTVVTPTPYACQNCHWEQDVVNVGWVPGDPDPTENAAGHPSTYDHYDDWNHFVGYWEYGLKIPIGDCSLEGTTHSTGATGTQFNPRCYLCHGNDPNATSYDPYNPELIRYCETCHDITTLHNLEGHVGPGGTGDPDAVDAWIATGFHTSDSETDPFSYRTFTANELCFGCHGGNIPAYEGELASAPSPAAMEPMAVCPTGYVEITGTSFGIEETSERGVKIKEGSTYIDVPVYSWTDTRIVIEIPAWTFTPGNHRVRVYTETGKDDTLPKLTIKDCASPLGISPISGECKTEIKLTNGSGLFGPSQDTISGAGATDGIFRTVEIVSSGALVAGQVKFWGNATVKVKLNNSDWFEDADGDYLRGTGEPVVLSCEELAVGTYSVYLKYIFYGDDDSSGTYTENDTIFQVETSNPVYFELTNDPYITGVNPKSFAKKDVVKIIGLNFGSTQAGNGFVYIGSKKQYLGDCIQAAPGISRPHVECECWGKHCFRYAVDSDGDLVDDPANLWDVDNPPTDTGGRLQPDNKIMMWSSTKLKVTVVFNDTKPAWSPGKKKYMWVVKDGKVSNAYKIRISP